MVQAGLLPETAADSSPDAGPAAGAIPRALVELSRLLASPRRAGRHSSVLSEALRKVYRVERGRPPRRREAPHEAAVAVPVVVPVRAVASGRDRRAFPRRFGECGVAVFRLADRAHVGPQHDWLLHGTRLRGELLDVSMNGVAFLLDQGVERGEALLLRLNNRRTGFALDCRVEVLRVTSSDGKRKVVCRFARNLSFEQVCALGWQAFDGAVV